MCWAVACRAYPGHRSLARLGRLNGGLTVAEDEGRSVLGPVQTIELHVVFEVRRRIDERHAASLTGDVLVSEVQAGGDACQEVLAFHVGPAFAFVPVDPIVYLLAKRFDDLDKTKIVCAQPWFVVMVTEAAQVGEDRVPVCRGRGLAGCQEAGQFEVGMIEEQGQFALIVREVDQVVVRH